MSTNGLVYRPHGLHWWAIVAVTILVFWVPLLWWFGFFDLCARMLVHLKTYLSGPIDGTDLAVLVIVMSLVLLIGRRRRQTIGIVFIPIDPMEDRRHDIHTSAE